MDLASLLPWPDLAWEIPPTENSHSTLGKVMEYFEYSRATFHGCKGERLAAHNFEDSIRVWNRLNQLEELVHRDSTVNWKHAQSESVCYEYILWALNAYTPLRYNPFLTHWWEFHQRWASRVAAIERDIAFRGPDGHFKRDCIVARLAIVDSVLKGGHDVSVQSPVLPTEMARNNDIMIHISDQITIPADISDLFQLAPFPTEVDVTPFIRMLEEEGIYDRPSYMTPDTQGSTENADNASTLVQPSDGRQQDGPDAKEELDATSPYLTAKATNGNATPPASDAPEQRMNDVSPIDIVDGASAKKDLHSEQMDPDFMRKVLLDDPGRLQDIVRVPMNLKSLENINTLVEHDVFNDTGITTAEAVRQFIQHKLRVLEGSGDEEDAIPAGKDEQQRVVQLLILFMRNLIKKGYVAPEEIFFEIQEICTRYIWMKEVRDFEAFVQGGEVTELQAELRMGG